MNLFEITQNPRVKVESVELEDADQNFRIQEMGLKAGMEFEIKQNAVSGGKILDIGNTNIAIDSATSKKIVIKVINGKEMRKMPT